MAQEAFGQRLQRIREEKGLSQPQLAKAAGVAVGSLRNWEQGRREPAVTVAAQLARALGIPLDDLASDQPAGQEKKPVEKVKRSRPKKPGTEKE